jgi:isoleucyl-tRNA synthetase
MDLKATLNLPDPDFTIPMKAGLPSLEPEIQARWAQMGIYHAIQAAREGAPSFVLHDGPPYTNGPVHAGTALNKVLKDFVVKSRTMMGFRAPYVPGYDNHGLPIEQTVLKAFHSRKEEPDLLALRRACREHAARYIVVQSEQFQRLGVFGLWEKPYATMQYRFEAEIVRVFKRMALEGQVYRGLRPVLWSPASRTALADTEVVYQDHTSRSIHVRFALRQDANGWSGGLENVYAIIWTTTPWTIPGNLAVAFHPHLEYAVVRAGDAHYVVLGDLVERTMAKCGIADYEVVRVLLGVSFEGSRFGHPIFDRDSLAVLATYVNTDEGTGIVHTAPGHGREDFLTGMKYGLGALCPVDERGVLTKEAFEFEGVFYRDCDTKVVDRLAELGALLHSEEYVHSYPHAERDGQPVIFRTTEQWFVSIDDNGLRERMLEAIEKVEWFPENGKARIRAMVANRPDWCISRQRPWGVGIPVFYGSRTGAPVLDPVAIEAVAQLIEREGSDAWFEREPREILPGGYSHPDTGETEFRKETDVFDVWFDSGCTSLCVLEGAVEPAWKERWPCDLFLEGSDQHRGWFNVSLVIGMTVRGEAPYRQVLTHGFVNDEEGRKMSKRLGNVIDPVQACATYGADVVRLWAASVDTTDDVAFGAGILAQCGEMYRRVRNTLRFLLANLYDFDPSEPEPPSMDLDRWIVEQTDLLATDCVGAYDRYEFGRVVTAIHQFCTQQLSAFYLDAIKDRMYCDGKDWPSRRSGQWACYRVLNHLVRLLAPVLPHTAEETYARIPGDRRLASVHMERFEVPTVERLDEIEGSPLQTRIASMLETRAGAFAQFEAWKAESGVKDTQDVVVTLRANGEALDALRACGDELPVLFKMSAVELVEGEPDVSFRVTGYATCERSRVRRPDVSEHRGHLLCDRCKRAVSEP